MAEIYKHLTTQERAVVMTMRDDQCSTRSIDKRLCRSASTISRELKRTSGAGVYDADAAHTTLGRQSRDHSAPRPKTCQGSDAVFTGQAQPAVARVKLSP